MKLDMENAIMADAFLNLCGYIKATTEDDEISAESKLRIILRGVEQYQNNVKEQIARYCKE